MTASQNISDSLNLFTSGQIVLIDCFVLKKSRTHNLHRVILYMNEVDKIKIEIVLKRVLK